MSTAPLHILLVEDEPGTLITTAMLLEMSGYRVTKAANGLRGLESFQHERPALVITDYKMPLMDGLELIRQIRTDESARAIPALLMSSSLPSDIDPNAVADAFVAKPFNFDQLKEVIERLLQQGGGSLKSVV